MKNLKRWHIVILIITISLGCVYSLLVIVQAPVLIRGMVQIDLTSHLRW